MMREKADDYCMFRKGFIRKWYKRAAAKICKSFGNRCSSQEKTILLTIIKTNQPPLLAVRCRTLSVFITWRNIIPWYLARSLLRHETENMFYCLPQLQHGCHFHDFDICGPKLSRYFELLKYQIDQILHTTSMNNSPLLLPLFPTSHKYKDGRASINCNSFPLSLISSQALYWSYPLFIQLVNFMEISQRPNKAKN